MSRKELSELAQFFLRLIETRELLEARLEHVTAHAPERLPALKNRIAKLRAMQKYTHRLLHSFDFSYIGRWRDLWNIAMLCVAFVRAKVPMRNGKPDLDAYLRNSGDI